MCKFMLGHASLLQNKHVHTSLQLRPVTVHMWKQPNFSSSGIANGRMRVSIAIQEFGLQIWAAAANT